MFILGMFFGFLIAVVVFIVSATYAKEIQTSFKTTSQTLRPPEKAILFPNKPKTEDFLTSLTHDDTDGIKML